MGFCAASSMRVSVDPFMRASVSLYIWKPNCCLHVCVLVLGGRWGAKGLFCVCVCVCALVSM